MNLTIIENTAVQNIPVQLKKFVEAKFKPTIKSYSDYDLERGIKNIIIISFTELGIKDAGEDKITTFLCETLLRDLRAAKFEHITLEEIQLFISNGIRGEYGSFNNQMNTINIQNLHWWIRKGMESVERKNALDAFNKELDKINKSGKPVFYTPEQFKKLAIEAFNDYKNSGKMPYVPHVIYDTIKESLNVKSLINQEDWPYIQAEGIEEYKRKYTFGKREHELKKIIENLDLSKDNKALSFATKGVALKHYFDKLIAEGKEI